MVEAAASATDRKMRKILEHVIRRFMVLGRLDLTWPDGSASEFRGRAVGPHHAVTLSGPTIVRRLLLNPALAVGEGYMDGSLVPADGDLYGVLDLLLANLAAGSSLPAMLRLRLGLQKATRRIAQYNQRDRARRNVAHHYDLDGSVYDLFLDRDRQYSCAYFATGRETIDEAQAAKKELIARKLCLDRPGLEVLDIGCGWGGTALTLARDYGAQVTGINLSTEQLAVARARAAAEGLEDRVSFELADYRSIDRTFDRIVSIGMFEHVGIGHYGTYFATARRCLREDGIGVVHAIGRSNGSSATNPWIAKYIFPGGYSPALSEVLPPLERNGLIATDVEILRLHYARTLRIWRERFLAARERVLARHDPQFLRMFEFYLTSSELAFRRQHHMVFQIQFARRQDAVPLTRDYLREVKAPAPARPSCIPVAG